MEKLSGLLDLSVISRVSVKRGSTSILGSYTGLWRSKLQAHGVTNYNIIQCYSNIHMHLGKFTC